MKLNEARKKMRSTLGMDLNIGVEEAIENFWLMGDFLELGEIKKQTKNAIQLFPFNDNR